MSLELNLVESIGANSPCFAIGSSLGESFMEAIAYAQTNVAINQDLWTGLIASQVKAMMEDLGKKEALLVLDMLRTRIE